MSSKIVHFEEVENVLDKMMKVSILGLSEKRKMLQDESVRFFLDPNLIMDKRHNMLHKSLPNSTNMLEMKKILAQDKANELRKEREKKFFEFELRKFEKQLHDFRPKFQSHKMCSKKFLADSNDENFWCGASNNFSVTSAQKFKCMNFVKSKPKIDTINDEINHISFSGEIKVTITDKPISESKETKMKILKKCLEALKQNANEKKRLHELKIKVQECLANRLLRRCFEAWKKWTENVKRLARKRKESKEISHGRRIEIFVNAIIKKQQELLKIQKIMKKETRVKSAPEIKSQSTVLPKQIYVVESPAQSRLQAQKKIIEMQKMKLAEQKRIIEEMRLKEIEHDAQKSSKKIVDTAKEVFDHCGPNAKRTLLHLIREEGYSDKSLVKPMSSHNPPEFLIRMEARAHARKERIMRANEAREKKLEEQKKKEEMARKKEEEDRKRLQQEAQREAKRLREGQKQRRIQELERFKNLVEKADSYYRWYLLRNYIMNVFKKLLTIKQNNVKQANDYYKRTLRTKAFVAWMQHTNEQYEAKVCLAVSIYNRSLLDNIFSEWKSYVVEEKQKHQVAIDIYDMKLQSKILRIWRMRAIEIRMENMKNMQRMKKYYEKRLLIMYFRRWRRYPEIVAEVRESERRKEELRAVVQKVIPDFDPMQRGVAIND